MKDLRCESSVEIRIYGSVKLYDRANDCVSNVEIVLLSRRPSICPTLFMLGLVPPVAIVYGEANCNRDEVFASLFKQVTELRGEEAWYEKVRELGHVGALRRAEV